MPLRVADRGYEVELSDLTLRRMVQLVEKTRRAERGFHLCKVDTTVEPGRENTGGVSSISIKDCGRGYSVGTFHTHPEYKVVGTSAPSWGDGYFIAKSSLLRTSIGCRGGASDRRVRCEVMKETPSPDYISKLRRKYTDWAHTPLSEDSDFEGKLETVVNLPIGQIEEIIGKPPVKPPAPPTPPPIEVAKTALYREGAIAGFDISHPKPTRATLVDMIHGQHPELSMSELDNARIIYYDGYAEVRLK